MQLNIFCLYTTMLYIRWGVNDPIVLLKPSKKENYVYDWIN